MQRFHFPLDRVLSLRRTQCRAEESKLEQLHADLRRIDGLAVELALEVNCAEDAVRAANASFGEDLFALDTFRNHARTRETQLGETRTAIKERIAVQTGTVVNKRRDVRLLEKLRERKMTLWSAQAERELTQQAEEFFLGNQRRLQ